MAILPVKKGISAPAVTSIPEEWDKIWFRNFITSYLVNADIRNAVTGPGIVITGNVSGNTTNAGGSSSVTITQAPIPNNTVLGNVSGATAVPVALNQTQLTALVNIFTATLSGAVPAPITSTGRFLEDNGTWATITIPVGANPTASVGLTAVNGSATTFMRSDAAPPLDVTIAPTWTGKHIFAAVSAGTLDGFSINIDNALPGIQYRNSAAPADAKIWYNFIDSSGSYRLGSYTDSLAVAREAFQITRTGGAIAGVSVGNATNNPTYNFLGTGVSTFSGPITVTPGAVPPSGASVFVNGFANKDTIIATGSSTTNQSFGVFIQAGTTSADNALQISDSTNTKSRLAVRGDGYIAIGAPDGATGHLIQGSGSSIALTVGSGFSGATAGATLSIRRANSTANTIGVGPALDLTDTAATTASMFQHSGGQTELWQTQNNGVTWNQVWKALTTREVIINAPASGTALTVNGVASNSTLLLNNTHSLNTVVMRLQDVGHDDVGLEWQRNTSTLGILISYDRTGAAYTGLNIAASTIRLQRSGTDAMNMDVNGAFSIAAPGSGNALNITAASATLSILATSGPVGVTNNVKPCFVLNSSGSDYGFIQNDAANTWSLAHGTVATNIGTPVLQWDATGHVIISGVASGSSLQVNSGGSSSALFIGGTAGQASVSINNQTQTGSATATFSSTTKPGGATAPTKWWPINFDGTIYYIPLWL